VQEAKSRMSRRQSTLGTLLSTTASAEVGFGRKSNTTTCGEMFLKTDRETSVCKAERSCSVHAARAALSLIASLLGKVEQDCSLGAHRI
jgi:hypothetical protein